MDYPSPSFRRPQRFAVALLVAACSLAALLLRPAAAAPRTFDPGRLARMDGLIQQSIDREALAGGVLYVARDGVPARLQAFGWRDKERGIRMSEDSIFRIASMSKAVTSVAVMILYEEGRFLLHDPVSKYLPAFAHSVVAEPAPAGSPAGVTYVTVPARRPIQIRDLLTHTAGLTYGNGLAVERYKAAGLHGWYLADKDETIADCINRLATLPLHGHPGEAWQYGYGTDVLGYLVEVVSGQTLDRFIAERICAPLGMTDTSFFLPLEKVNRLAPVYGFEDGKLTLREPTEKSDYVHGPRKCFSGGAGLLSTARDYGRFLQMLLNGGQLDGVRVLSPKTVELMTANHTGTLFRNDTNAHGLGFWVNQDLGAFGELGSEGAYGWGSAYYPQYLVDPKEGVVAFFMTQLLPSGGLDLNRKLKVSVYQAIVD
jgi:CubicO group peptidase (beta-lactamase class C family)